MNTAPEDGDHKLRTQCPKTQEARTSIVERLSASEDGGSHRYGVDQMRQPKL